MKYVALTLILLTTFTANAQFKGTDGENVQQQDIRTSNSDPRQFRPDYPDNPMGDLYDDEKLEGFITNKVPSNVVIDYFTVGCLWTGSSCKKTAASSPICHLEDESCENGYKGSSININGFIGYFCYSYDSQYVKYCGDAPVAKCKLTTPFDTEPGCEVGEIGGIIEKGDDYIWTCQIGNHTQLCQSPKYDGDEGTDPQVNPPVCSSTEYACDIGTVGNIMPPNRWTCTNDDITVDCGGNSNNPPSCGATDFSCDSGNVIEDPNDPNYWMCKSGSNTVTCYVEPATEPEPEQPPMDNCLCTDVYGFDWITASNAQNGQPYCKNLRTGESKICPERGGNTNPPAEPEPEPTFASKCGYDGGRINSISGETDFDYYCFDNFNSNNRDFTESQFESFILNTVDTFDANSFESMLSSTGDNAIRAHEQGYDEVSMNGGTNKFYEVVFTTHMNAVNIYLRTEHYEDEERTFYFLSIEDVVVTSGGTVFGNAKVYQIEKSTATGAFYNFDKQSYASPELQ